MDAKEYLQSTLKIDGAIGPDGELWEDGRVRVSETFYENSAEVKISNGDTDYNTKRFKVAPNQKIQVQLKAKSLGEAGKKLAILH